MEASKRVNAEQDSPWIVESGRAAVAGIADDIPYWLRPFSIARAQIIAQQWTDYLHRTGEDAVVCVTVSSAEEAKRAQPVACAVAGLDADGESATLMFAGGIAESGDPAIASVLQKRLDRELHDRGVKFVQAATDPIDDSEHQFVWPDSLGYQMLATLQYLSLNLDSNEENRTDNRSIEFRALVTEMDGEIGDKMSRFAHLTRQTYESSLDCPALENLRSVEGLLTSYRAGTNFDPSGWFTVTENGVDVGVLILALNQPGSDDPADASPSAELTYMGLVPESRRRGVGRQILNAAIQWSTLRAATQLVLAVDAINAPAIALYQSCGFQSVIRETVWGKNISNS